MEEFDSNNILVKIYEGQQEIKEQLKIIPNMQKSIQELKEEVKIIPNMQKSIQELKEEVKIIPNMQKSIQELKEEVKIIPHMQKSIQEIKDNMQEMKEELRHISGSVARIEVEHGEKLAMLFDAFSVHEEKLNLHEKQIDSCKRKIEKQDDQIYYLKSKVQGL